MLGAHPVKASATGSRAGRTAEGEDIYSHFDVIYHYPNGAHVSFSSAQFGKGKFDVNERFFGTKGQSQSPYSGELGIVGDAPWTWTGSESGQGAAFSASGSFSDNLAQADSEKQKGFIASIASRTIPQPSGGRRGNGAHGHAGTRSGVPGTRTYLG